MTVPIIKQVDRRRYKIPGRQSRSYTEIEHGRKKQGSACGYIYENIRRASMHSTE